jgi:hypothetical protein
MRRVVVAAAFVVLAIAPTAGAASVRAAFEPNAVGFGDTVTARVVVTGPDAPRVVYSVAPLTQLGPTRIRRAERDGVAVVVYETPAACLTEACVSPSGRARITPEPVRAGGTTVDWRPLTVTGRVTEADLSAARLPFRADTTVPPATFRFDPSTLANVLVAAAIVLVASGAALVVLAVLRGRRAREVEREDELARALRLARDARDRPERDRRAAAGLVARLLARRDDAHARAADDLAWSRPSPTPDELTELVRGVEGERPS